MKLIPVCLALVVSSQAHALGVVNGGGGNEVVCFDNAKIVKDIKDPASPNYQQISDEQLDHITSVEALDLYMAKMPKGLQATPPLLIPEIQTESEQQFVKRTYDRFIMYFPTLSNLIWYGTRYFPDENIMMSSGGISRVADENNSIYLGNPKCVVATVAFQHDSASNSGYLEIDNRLYHHPKQTQYSRNVLFLHEIIYSQTRTVYHATDSLSTRTLIGQILKQSLTVGSILKTWDEAGLLTHKTWGPYLDFLRVPNGLYSLLGLVHASYTYISAHPESNWPDVIKTYCPLPQYNGGLACPDKMQKAAFDLLQKMKWNATTKKFDVPVEWLGDTYAYLFIQKPDIWGPGLLSLEIPVN